MRSTIITAIRTNGVEQVLVYQVGASSESGGLPNWRRFNLVEMLRLQVLDRTFPGPRPPPIGEHSPWDIRYAVVQ